MDSTNKLNIIKSKNLYNMCYLIGSQRFSYYGLQCLLVLYLINYYNFIDLKACQIVGLFTCIMFLTPIIGGYIADKFLMYRNSIIIGAGIISLGFFMLIFNVSVK